MLHLDNNAKAYIVRTTPPPQASGHGLRMGKEYLFQCSGVEAGRRRGKKVSLAVRDSLCRRGCALDAADATVLAGFQVLGESKREKKH